MATRERSDRHWKGFGRRLRVRLTARRAGTSVTHVLSVETALEQRDVLEESGWQVEVIPEPPADTPV